MAVANELVQDIMILDPVIVSGETTDREVSAIMRDLEIGDVLVSDGEHPGGVVTDRDLVVRALAGVSRAEPNG